MKNRYSIRLVAAALAFAAVLLCFEASFAAEGEPEDAAVPEEQTAAAAKPKVKAPGKVKSVKLSSKKESQVTVRWKPVKCSGYVIKYSRNRSLGKGTVRIRVSSKAASKTIKGLAKGKVYYFTVRAYKKSKGKVYYGKISEKKSVRVHKHVYKLVSTGNIATGKLMTYKCTCGVGYYKTKASNGKKYDGYLYSYPSCVPGKLQKWIGGKIQDLPCEKTHSLHLESDGTYKCSRCGQVMRYIKQKTTDIQLTSDGETKETVSEVIFEAPKNTNVSSCVAASVKNAEGKRYNYKLYWQKSSALKFKYEKYREYFAMHGCSTCALTAVLNAMVPKYRNYTPDRVLVEVIKPAVGTSTFNRNFSKSLPKQMPIGLKGVNKVLKDSGVKTKYRYNYTKKSAAKEIREHLEKGKPVIFMIRRSTYASNPHMMVMLGLDKKGKVIVGDSSLCSASKWGTGNRLIKFNTKKNKESNTVENICKFFKDSTSSVKGRSYFYDGRKGNIGYILVG